MLQRFASPVDSGPSPSPSFQGVRLAFVKNCRGSGIGFFGESEFQDPKFVCWQGTGLRNLSCYMQVRLGSFELLKSNLDVSS